MILFSRAGFAKRDRISDRELQLGGIEYKETERQRECREISAGARESDAVVARAHAGPHIGSEEMRSASERSVLLT